MFPREFVVVTFHHSIPLCFIRYTYHITDCNSHAGIFWKFYMSQFARFVSAEILD